MTTSSKTKCPPAGPHLHAEIKARFRTSDLMEISTRTLAMEYHCQPRTIIKRLGEMNTSFQHELNLERWRRFTTEMSWGPILSGPHYLLMMGFAQESSFTEWLRIQTGRTFSEIRAEVNLNHKQLIEAEGAPGYLVINAQPLDEETEHHETVH